jgi:molecular chaperone GrpE
MSKKSKVETEKNEKETNNGEPEVQEQEVNEAEPSNEVLALQQEIEELKEQLEQKNDQMLRNAAEFDNYRKRTQKERVLLFEDARVKALEDFLPIYDDMERMLSSIEESERTPFMEGTELIRNKFKQVLDKNGLERIDETGVPFDVDLHDALMKQPAEDETVESDIVLQVLESGYKVGERVIRHAKVIVSE